MKLQGLYFDCQIGKLGDEVFSVTDFKLEEGLSSLFVLTLTVVSERADINLNDLLLRSAVLTVYSYGHKQRTVEGIVEEVKRGKSGFHHTFYTFIVRPQLWLLTQRQQSRIFHFKTVPQLLELLMQEHGVRFDKQFYDEHPVREYITQKRETDFSFFQRLAAEEGISFWFECDKPGSGKCFLSDSRLGCTRDLSLSYNVHPQRPDTGYFIYDLALAAKMVAQQMQGIDRDYHNPDYDFVHHSVRQT